MPIYNDRYDDVADAAHQQYSAYIYLGNIFHKSRYTIFLHQRVQKPKLLLRLRLTQILYPVPCGAQPPTTSSSA